MIVIDKDSFKMHGYKEVVFISDRKIVVLIAGKQIQIEGEAFEISYYSNLEIHGKGNFKKITFEE